MSLFLLLTLFFGYFAGKLEQKTTVRDLLPAHNQVVKNFEDTVADFDLIDRIVVVLKFDPENLEAAQAFAEIFVDQIREQKKVDYYLHWITANLFAQTQSTNWHQYLQYLPRVLPYQQIPHLIDRLSDEGIRARVQENRRDLESGFTAKVLIEKDPLNLLEFAAPYRDEIAGNYRVNFTDGFIVSKDKGMLLIIGKPTKPPDDVEFSKELNDFFSENIAEAEEIFLDEGEGDPKELFQIGLTGPHPTTAQENKMIKNDVINMFVTSFAMVIFLFVLAYGRPLAIIYVGLPLLCAEIWTLGIGYLLFGRLNLLTAAFSAVIVGLGIDYAIHIFSRYLDERGKGLSPLKAMQISLSQTGMGTAIGGLTTAGAFLAMGISNFSGLQEFAIIAALGILLCMFQMFIILPCLLFLREKFRRQGKPVPPAQRDFHVEKLLSICFKYKKTTMALLLGTTVFLGIQALQLRFNTDIRSVRAKSNSSISLQNEVTERVGGSLRSLSFVLSSKTEAGLYQLHDQLLPELKRLKEEGGLVRFDSLLTILQNPQHQQQNLAALKNAGLTSAQIANSFTDAMEQQQFLLTEESRRYIENLGAGVETSEPLSLKTVLASEGNFTRPFLHYSDGTFKTLIHLYPSKGLWEKNTTEELTERILSAAPETDQSHIFVTGIQTISNELKKLVKDSFKYSTIFSIALVFLIMYLHFRNFSLLALTLFPLVIGVIWMLGFMKVLGLDITILNFVATPLIIGIGIDDGIHIVEKYLHRDSPQIDKLIATCGKAVTLTSLTTILGFSSLFMADYSGFQSLGLCAIMGVLFCWMSSVIMLPLVMEFCKIKFIRADVEEGA